MTRCTNSILITGITALLLCLSALPFVSTTNIHKPSAALIKGTHDKGQREFLQRCGEYATAAGLDEDPSEAVLDIRFWQDVDGNGTALRRILGGAFTSVGADRIVAVIIEGHNIVEIEEHAFDRIGKGEVLSLALAANGLTSIPRGLFNKLTSLRHLDLDRNQLSGRFPGSFAGMGALEALSLANNPSLKHLGPGLLTGLPSLKAVDIRGCPVATLSAYVLGPAIAVYNAPELQTVRFTASDQLGDCMVDAAGFAACRQCALLGFVVEEHAVHVACTYKTGHNNATTTIDQPGAAPSLPAAGSVAARDVMPQEHIVLVPSFDPAQPQSPTGGRHRSRRAVTVMPSPIDIITNATFTSLASR
jgi:hypothetical protein